jgi:hypothetical protein
MINNGKPNPLNAPSKWKVAVRKQQDKRLAAYTPFLGQFIGLLGRNDNVVQDPSKPDGYVFVRDSKGILMSMWNQKVPTDQPGIHILYGYTADEPKLLQVISQWTSYAQQPTMNLPHHESTHEFDAGDMIPIHGEQMLPWLVIPTPVSSPVYTPFSIDIYPGLDRVGSDWVFKNVTTIDLTSHIPTAGACFVIVCMDNAGAYTVVDGTPVSTPELLTGADIPAETTGTVVKAIVRLYSGQDSIRQTSDYTDIFDDRFAVGRGGSLPSETPYRILIVDSAGHIVTSSYFKTRSDGSLSPVFGSWEPAQAGDGLVHAVGDGSSVAGRFIAWFLGSSNQPGQTGIRGRGTPASPAYVHAGDVLEVVRGAGFGVTDIGGAVGYALSADAGSSALWSKGELRCIADADWSTDASWPTRWELWAVPIGGVDKQLIATFRTTGIDLPAGEIFSVNGVSIGVNTEAIERQWML